MSVLRKKVTSKKTVTAKKIKTGSGLHKAELVAYAAQNKKALEPVILDIQEVSGMAQYFVIVSGKTGTQVRAIVQEIERVCIEERIRIAHSEGLGQWSWVLIDLEDVVVHVFLDSERHYYQLEKLWQHCPRIPLREL